jgi:hypothetical protein
MAVALAVQPAAAQAAQPVGEPTRFESKHYSFSVLLPDGCRHEEGPGTIDAICSPDLDPQKSATAGQAGALVLSIVATEEVDTTDAAVQVRLGEAAFRDDLAESVCGESDRSRAKIENVKQYQETGVLVRSADVVCAEVRFLRLDKRRASVAQVIGRRGVFRLMARAPVDDFEKHRGLVDAFFESFFKSFRVLQPDQAAEKQ